MVQLKSTIASFFSNISVTLRTGASLSWLAPPPEGGDTGSGSLITNVIFARLLLPGRKMTKDTEESLDVYMYREEYGPWA